MTQFLDRSSAISEWFLRVKSPFRGSHPTILLRQSYREGKRVRKRTLANLTCLPPEAIEAIKRTLRGEKLVSCDQAFAIERSIPHGHVKAILGTIRKIGLDTIIASRRSRQRDLVVAMIAERLLHGCSKPAGTRLWHSTTLAEELSVQDADVNELYEAMDWLLEGQERIEKKLAARHLGEGAQVFYDVSSSYYEGHTCSLARHGHPQVGLVPRDGKKGRPIIVYGALTDRDGCPVAVQVYPGNTGDPSTVGDQVNKLRERFGISRVVLVGDRGMLTQTQIEKLRAYPQLGWISALRSGSIRKLVEDKELQLSLFDKQNLAEISSDEFPGERLIACFNPLLADERARKRQALLAATEEKLQRIAKQVARRTKTPLLTDEIALKVGRVINGHKVGKHFSLHIEDGVFRWERDEASIEQEAALDGIYVIRTSEPKKRLSAEDTVRSYKNLGQVEQVFRCFKGIDIRVRPIYHRDDPRVRAHVFLCLLAYYVEWHMRRTLGSVLFDDEELTANRKTRDPV
ncbi:MAG: IS1634 family transposase, partial [Planctomycetes bacterium]|nr:IS1634 family transposase [Planctomycetota bacterium]